MCKYACVIIKEGKMENIQVGNKEYVFNYLENVAKTYIGKEDVNQIVLIKQDDIGEIEIMYDWNWENTKIKYITCWEDSEEVITDAYINMESGEVYDIEAVPVSDEHQNLLGEFIQYGNGLVEQVISECGKYFVISQADKLWHLIELYDTEFIVSDKMDEEDVRRIFSLAN